MIPKKKLKDGNEIPILGFGTWQIEKEACTEAVKNALEIGYRHIDTAYAYYNEKYIGPAIKSYKREDLFITSKLWREFHHVKKVETACDISLKDLGTDYLDLYLIHWPEKENMLDILHEMHKLKDKGKIKSMGVCNATERHLADILEQDLDIVVDQVEFHPFLHQKELLKYCHDRNIALTAYSPIAQGEVFHNSAIQTIAKEHGKSPAQVTLKWLLQKDIIVIPKASSKEHAKENFDIFDFTLSEKEMTILGELHQDKRIVKPDFHEFDY
jgi:2,5-diketo-D-gluconate reductase B